MILVFHASALLQNEFAKLSNERALINKVMQNLDEYTLATRVKHSELDIAFAATGGPTNWVNCDNMTVDFSPTPTRQTDYGDVLVELSNGFANLSTPAGFIPLIDVVETNGDLTKKRLN